MDKDTTAFGFSPSSMAELPDMGVGQEERSEGMNSGRGGRQTSSGCHMGLRCTWRRSAGGQSGASAVAPPGPDTWVLLCPLMRCYYPDILACATVG